jgi:hypothetical protein
MSVPECEPDFKIAGDHFRLWPMLSKKWKIERHRKSRESRFFDTAAAARYSRANTMAGGRFRMNRCGSSGRRARSALAVFKIFVLHPKKTFSTASTHIGSGPSRRLEYNDERE